MDKWDRDRSAKVAATAYPEMCSTGSEIHLNQVTGSQREEVAMLRVYIAPQNLQGKAKDFPSW